MTTAKQREQWARWAATYRAKHPAKTKAARRAYNLAHAPQLRAREVARRPEKAAAARQRRAKHPGQAAAYARIYRKTASSKASVKKYRAAHPGVALAIGRKWRAAHPEKVRANNQKKYWANPEAARAYALRWVAANPERKRATDARRHREHPEIGRDAAKRRRAAKRGSQTEPIRSRDIYGRDSWSCQLCHQPVAQDYRARPRREWASLHHVKPLKLGGPHTAANLVLAHMGCNSRQGAKYGGT